MDYHVLTGKQERLYRLMKLHFASYFDDLPLTSTQAMVLEYVIKKAQGGDVFPKDIELFLSVRGSSAVSLINNLERNGYLKRETASFDGRYKKLLPTEKALDIEDDISARIEQYIQSLFIGIPESELKVFEAVLDKMIKNSRQHI